MQAYPDIMSLFRDKYSSVQFGIMIPIFSPSLGIYTTRINTYFTPSLLTYSWKEADGSIRTDNEDLGGPGHH